MKILYLLAIAWWATVLIGIPCQAGLAWETTRLEQKAFAGDVAVVSIFRFVNEGTGPVTILSVEPSCDCTKATIAKRVYLSGEKGEVVVTFLLGDRVGVQTQT